MLDKLIPIQKIKERAWAETCQIFDRTTPLGCPADLDDSNGKLHTTADGYSVAGLAFPEEMGWGGKSPVYYIYLPILIALTACLIVFYSGKIPEFHPGSIQFGGFFSKFVLLFNIVPWSLIFLMTSLYVLLSFFNLEREDYQKNRVARFLSRAGLILFCVFAFTVLPILLHTFSAHAITLPLWFMLAAVACISTTFFLQYSETRDRLTKQQWQAKAYPGVSLLDAHFKAAKTARQKQAVSAANDTSDFIALGTATGIFAERHADEFAPDPEKIVGLTARDLSTHLLAVGRTGTGKTSAILRPIVQQWQSGGLVVLDGKGELPTEFKDEPNYTLITPGTGLNLALIEGLKTEDVVDILVNIAGSSSGSQQDGKKSDPFWQASGETLLRNACFLLELASDKEKFPWTIAAISEIIMSKGYRTALIDSFDTDENLWDRADSFLVPTASNYFMNEFEKMPENTRGSVVSTVSAWLSPLLGHRELSPWAKSAKGDIDPASVLTGARIGVNCPAYKYGSGGLAVTAFVKARIYRAARQRGSEWSKVPGQTSCLLVVDEMQEVLGKTDNDMLPVARSLGLSVVAATQSYDEIESRIGIYQAAALTGNFRSSIVFASTEKTLSWISAQLGQTYRTIWDTVEYDFKGTWKASLASQNFNLIRGGSVGIIDTADKQSENLTEHAGKQAHGVLFKRELAAVCSPGEAGNYLQTPFRAVALINRAGVPRRDIIDTAPVFV
jgi:hypothetical protein